VIISLRKLREADEERKEYVLKERQQERKIHIANIRPSCCKHVSQSQFAAGAKRIKKMWNKRVESPSLTVSKVQPLRLTWTDKFILVKGLCV
jgi:hypothetical protein